MVGDVPSALDLHHLNPPALQHLCRQRKAPRPGAPAQRHDGVVLDQEQNVLRQLPRQPLPPELTLQLQHLGVGPAAQVMDVEWPHQVAPWRSVEASRRSSNPPASAPAPTPSRARWPKKWCSGAASTDITK